MRRLAAIALMMAACESKPAGVDCEAIVRDPAHGTALLATQFDDPVKVWQTLEGCLVPQGDDCERASVGAAMAPRMIGDKPGDTSVEAGVRVEARRQWVLRCRKLPADQQRCLQVSYSLGHAECTKLIERARFDIR